VSTIENTVIDNLTPSEFYLSQNYPNPFSEKTKIKYCVAYKTKVKLEVFSSEGKMIKILIDEEKEAGTYEVEFSREVGSATGGNANGFSSGTYFYRLIAGDYKNEKKMALKK
jgi:hypothetical protein